MSETASEPARSEMRISQPVMSAKPSVVPEKQVTRDLESDVKHRSVPAKKLTTGSASQQLAGGREGLTNVFANTAKFFSTGFVVGGLSAAVWLLITFSFSDESSPLIASTAKSAAVGEGQEPSTRADASDPVESFIRQFESESSAQIALEDSRSRKMKEIAVAIMNHRDTYKGLQIPDKSKYFDADGRPKVSWRVHLLPFLSHAPLYDQFKLDESWDSESNIQLIDKMPEIYRDLLDPIDSSKTRFVTLTGPYTLFPTPKGMSIDEVSDGMARTIQLLFTGADNAVVWTAPQDCVFDAENPMACWGKTDFDLLLFAFVDCAVKRIKTDFPPDLFKAIVTPRGGEKMSFNELQPFIIR
ncbi:MAG: DUF1559 domain-containing protein [Pirellulaceae bacterium]